MSKTIGPTPRQQELVDVLARETQRRGAPPTFRELAGLLGGISTNAVNDLVRALERKGAIRRETKKSRGLVLVNPPRRATCEHLMDVKDALSAMEAGNVEQARKILQDMIEQG
jgi:SOS-response transcriptional repressor LexA